MIDIWQKAQRALDSSHLPLSLCISSPPQLLCILAFFALLPTIFPV